MAHLQSGLLLSLLEDNARDPGSIRNWRGARRLPDTIDESKIEAGRDKGVLRDPGGQQGRRR
jgi:hypothetical protein